MRPWRRSSSLSSRRPWRPVVDFRQAFDLQDYKLDGTASGEFHLYGEYTRPYGFGRLTIDRGESYGEPFSSASVRFSFERAAAANSTNKDKAVFAAACVAHSKCLLVVCHQSFSDPASDPAPPPK